MSHATLGLVIIQYKYWGGSRARWKFFGGGWVGGALGWLSLQNFWRMSHLIRQGSQNGGILGASFWMGPESCEAGSGCLERPSEKG